MGAGGWGRSIDRQGRKGATAGQEGVTGSEMTRELVCGIKKMELTRTK